MSKSGKGKQDRTDDDACIQDLSISCATLSIYITQESQSMQHTKNSEEVNGAFMIMV